MVSDTCYLYKAIDNYAPPDYYPTFRNQTDVNNFLSYLNTNGVARGGVLNMSIDNYLGRVRFQVKSDHSGGSIEELYDPAIVYVIQHDRYYIGTVDSLKHISEDVIEVGFTVDWYSSYLITKFKENASYGGVVAKTVMYRRKTGGEFDYLAEGFTPKSINSVRNSNFQSIVGSGSSKSFFDTTNNAYYLCYHDTVKNTDHKILYILKPGVLTPPTPKSIWDTYCSRKGVTQSAGTTDICEFQPSGVMFYGYPTVNLDCLITTDVYDDTNYTIYCLNKVTTTTYSTTIGGVTYTLTVFDRSDDLEITADWKIHIIGNDLVATEYHRLRIIDGSGNTVYEFPMGLGLRGSVSPSMTLLTAKSVFAGSPNAPYIQFIITVDLFKRDGTLSFSVPFNELTYFADSYQEYLVRDKVYQNSMRSLQTINELVSGVIGGVNQGAMISAFSRTQTGAGSSRGGSPQPPLAIDKGLIGGGLAIAGSGAMYAYKTLYANKEVERIEDNYNRCKPDALALAGGTPRYTQSGLAGLYEISYDSDTVTAITGYQSKFGYATNSIGTDVALNGLTDYVQAEVILNKGLRKDVEQYIKDMFNYGVTFTVIGGS